MSNEERILSLEQKLGLTLPSDYRDFIATHRESSNRPPQVVSSNPDYWGVSNIFELGDGASYLQVDENYRLVGDVIPKATVAIADDGAGNLFLLDCRLGSGRVDWWDHEQNLGEDRVEMAASSFTEFLSIFDARPGQLTAAFHPIGHSTPSIQFFAL